MKTGVILAAGLSLFGPRVVSSIPDGYTGPTAQIRDTSTQRPGTTALDIFSLEKIGGNEIDNSVLETAEATQGRGMNVSPRIIDRRVPAQDSTFTLHALNYYGAPIQAMFNKVYSVSGDVHFTPMADHIYEVEGVLGADYSAVWIEDEVTHQVMDHKIEAGTPPQ
ncbi:MAG TPA: hypothetical protein VGG10_00190 [Rhizomicrobium sp.]|jgi:hypothetical protein